MSESNLERGIPLAPTLERTRDQLDAAVVPLPGEPVGVGARWRATTTSQS